MAAVPFDTLKLAQHLASGGVPPEQANATASALADAMSGAEMSTKADLAVLERDLKIWVGKMLAWHLTATATLIGAAVALIKLT